MSRPIIGITMTSGDDPKTGEKYTRHLLNRAYIDRVSEAGGAPILLPPGTDPASVLPGLDGLLITGGDDIDSANWGEPPHPESSFEDPRRAALELALLKAADPRMPVFGICYGCQMLNVSFGGSITQHLPDVVGDDKHRGDPVQQYTVEPGSKLAKILGGERAEGRSSHHQAVNQTGPGLKVVARHEDGTIEAVETEDQRWIVGVQWHPERTASDTSDKLFDSFVRAAERYREEKAACGTW